MRSALQLAAAAAASHAAAAEPAAPTGKPNVVMIVIDDLGFDDMGFRMELNGQSPQIDTKNVDKLAREGVVLDAYYVQCVCSPSRVTFLTGRYPLHHGINDWIPPSSSYGMVRALHFRLCHSFYHTTLRSLCGAAAQRDHDSRSLQVRWLQDPRHREVARGVLHGPVHTHVQGLR